MFYSQDVKQGTDWIRLAFAEVHRGCTDCSLAGHLGSNWNKKREEKKVSLKAVAMGMGRQKGILSVIMDKL